jgi:hypothetical protein
VSEISQKMHVMKPDSHQVHQNNTACLQSALAEESSARRSHQSPCQPVRARKNIDSIISQGVYIRPYAQTLGLNFTCTYMQGDVVKLT